MKITRRQFMGAIAALLGSSYLPKLPEAAAQTDAEVLAEVDATLQQVWGDSAIFEWDGPSLQLYSGLIGGGKSLVKVPVYDDYENVVGEEDVEIDSTPKLLATLELDEPEIKNGVVTFNGAAGTVNETGVVRWAKVVGRSGNELFSIAESDLQFNQAYLTAGGMVRLNAWVGTIDTEPGLVTTDAVKDAALRSLFERS